MRQKFEWKLVVEDTAALVFAEKNILNLAGLTVAMAVEAVAFAWSEIRILTPWWILDIRAYSAVLKVRRVVVEIALGPVAKT